MPSTRTLVSAVLAFLPIISGVFCMLALSGCRPMERDVLIPFSLTFSPDGDTLVAAGAADSEYRTGILRAWDTTTFQVKAQLHNEFTASVDDVAYALDGALLAAACPLEKRTVGAPVVTGEIQIWDARTWTMVAKLSKGKRRFENVIFSSDGNVVAGAAVGGGIVLWDRKTEREKQAWSFASLTSDNIPVAPHIALSSDSRKLAAIFEWGDIVALWDVGNGNLLRTLKCTDKCSSAAHSNDGKHLAIGDFHGNIHVLDIGAAEELKKWKAHEKKIIALCFSDKNDVLVSAGEEGLIHVWDFAKRRVLRTLSQKDFTPMRLAVSSRRGLVGAADCAAGNTPRIILWDIATGRQIKELR